MRRPAKFSSPALCLVLAAGMTFSVAAAEPAAAAAPEPLLLARLAAHTLPSDFIKLGEDAEPFLARYVTATKTPAKGAVLWLPTNGRFIGDDAMITAALSEFPAAGWSVLAVQTPLLPAIAERSAYDALAPQALARAQLGLAHLAKAGLRHIIVVGSGANVALARQLAAAGGSGVDAVVALGPWAGELGGSTIPLYELIADRDTAALAAAAQRQREAQSANLTGYKQFVLAGADLRYLGFAAEIARRIHGWIEQLPAPLAASPR